MLARKKRLRAQRDDLLEAIRLALPYMGSGPTLGGFGIAREDCALAHIDYFGGVESASSVLANAAAEVKGTTAAEVHREWGAESRPCDGPCCIGEEAAAEAREKHRAAYTNVATWKGNDMAAPESTELRGGKWDGHVLGEVTCARHDTILVNGRVRYLGTGNVTDGGHWEAVYQEMKGDTLEKNRLRVRAGIRDRASLARALVRLASRCWQQSYDATEHEGRWWDTPWSKLAFRVDRIAIPLATRVHRDAASEQMVEEDWWG